MSLGKLLELSDYAVVLTLTLQHAVLLYQDIPCEQVTADIELIFTEWSRFLRLLHSI